MQCLRRRLEDLGVWERIAAVAWAILTFLAVGRAALVELPRHAGCYGVFAQAGRGWLAGQDLYSAREGLDVFRYSPLVAAFFAPFGALPDPLGSALLRMVNLAVFLGGLAWWSRVALPMPLSSKQRAILFLLVMPLAGHSLVDIQTNALTVGLLLLGVTAAATDRWTASAVALTLACCIKVYPLSLALLLVVLYPRRFAFRFVLIAATCLACPFLLQQPGYVLHQYQDWIRWGLNDRQGADLASCFRDLRLLCRVWLIPLSTSTYHFCQVGTGVAIAGFCLVEQRRGIPARRILTTAFGLSCGWMMLLGPATEATTYIFLAPTLAWALLDGWRGPHSGAYRIALLSSLLLFTATQVVLWFPGGSSFHRLAPHPIAALLLMAALVLSEIQRVAPPRFALSLTYRARPT